jgi:putative ABC transport system permease protein
MSELRQAARSLLRAPASSLCIILILAIGAGANTGAFSALYAALLKPLPYPEPDRLFELYETTADRKPRGVAMANLLDWRARSELFEAMAAYQPRTFGLTRGERDAVTVVQTGMVMPEFFATLGVAPAMGRVFGEREEAVLVLSERLWRRMFAADTDVIGRTVELNEEPHTVIGVMPAGFEYPMGAALPDAYLPLSRRDYCCGRLGSQAAIARIKAGVSMDRATSELEAIAAGLAREHPASNGGRTAGIRPLHAALTGGRREPLLLLGGAAALLLAIACANVAGLLLARALRRRREFEIRLWLGAGLSRVLRPFFLEAAILAACGAAVGLAAARAFAELNAAALAMAFATAIGVTLLLGAAPALLVLRRSRPRGRVRNGLVVTQVALSVVLLLSTAVLLRSLLRLVQTDPGFSTVHAWRFGIGLPEKRYDTDGKLIVFHQELERKLSDLPGVTAVGASIRLPLRGGAPGQGGTFQLAGANLPLPERPRAAINLASPGYFDAMGIPLIDGRAFSWQHDRLGQPRVAIVNRTFARMYRTRIGTLLDLRGICEIVGVVADTRQANLEHEPGPEIFLSLTQAGSEGAGYAIRARSDDPALPRAIETAVAAQDPRIQRVKVDRLAGLVEGNLEARNSAIRLVGGLGALALLLTAVGIYGIVAFRAAERSREMAIRSALGASAPHLRKLVLGHGARLALFGTAVGLLGFACAAPLLKGQLYAVSAIDPVSIAAVAAGVFAIALLASFAPSRRAGRAAPMDLLREL